MDIKMIACDLDGTLLTKQHEVSPFTKQMLLEAQKRGIIVTLATGRDKGSLDFVYEPLELENGNNYVAGINGQVIYSFQKKEYFVDDVMDGEDAMKCMQVAKKFNLECICCCGYDHYNYISKPLKLMKQVRSLLAGQPTDYGLQDGKRNFIEVDIDQLEITQDINKIIYIQSAKFFRKNLPALRAALQDYEVLMVGDAWMEIMPKGVSKGNALKRIAAENGFTMDNVMVFGDAENDLSMFDMAGCSVAMGNAMPIVKEHASMICDDNEHDGIGKTIENYLFQAKTESVK